MKTRKFKATIIIDHKSNNVDIKLDGDYNKIDEDIDRAINALDKMHKDKFLDTFKTQFEEKRK